ncbi:MAG: hypothetical protein J7L43_02610 [Candidatus Aenigmarchaeota archaeon]|nr:hypothetical protein [Candidatus Aenigmarchaeota archaeon]
MDQYDKKIHELSMKMPQDDIYGYLIAKWWKKYENDIVTRDMKYGFTSVYQFLQVLGRTNTSIWVDGDIDWILKFTTKKVKRSNRDKIKPVITPSSIVCRGAIFYNDKDREILRGMDEGKFKVPEKGYLLCSALLYPIPRVIEYKRIDKPVKGAAGLDKVCRRGGCEFKKLLEDAGAKKIRETSTGYLADEVIELVNGKYSKYLKELDSIDVNKPNFMDTKILGLWEDEEEEMRNYF